MRFCSRLIIISSCSQVRLHRIVPRIRHQDHTIKPGIPVSERPASGAFTDQSFHRPYKCKNQSFHLKDIHKTKIAKRATWLGNDATHYYRKWEDKDIHDLKNLIELTVLWIESVELTRQHEEDM